MNSRSSLTSMLLAASALMSPCMADAAEINLYTTREPALIAPLLEAFTKSSGTKVNTIFLKDGLAERVASELQTAVAKAERDLSFTEIRAPVDGVVGNKAAEVGTYVQPGARLAAIVPLATVHVDANFKETQLAAL